MLLLTRARVCVYLYSFIVNTRARACVYLYSFIVKTSSVFNDVLDILEGMDQRSFFVSIILGASAKFLHLHI